MEAQNLKILIVEDDFSFSLELEMLVKEIGYQVIATVDNSAEALECIMTDEPDLVLMDIDIKGKFSGIEVAEKVKHLQLPILFITSVEEQVVYDRAQKINLIAYMVKPLASFTLRSSIELAIKQLQSPSKVSDKQENTTVLSPKRALFFKKNGVFKKINTAEINYVEADGNYSLTITATERLITSLTLTELEGVLDSHHFMRVHRGYLVNLKKIDYLDMVNNKILIGSQSIPISRSKKTILLERIQLVQ